MEGGCVQGEDIEIGGKYYDRLSLCGNKDDNGNLVDDQICICFTDLCNALWKEIPATTATTTTTTISRTTEERENSATAIAVTGATLALASISIAILSIIRMSMNFVES